MLKIFSKSKNSNPNINLEVFKLTVDNSSNYIAIADANGIITYVNKATKNITGFSRLEMVGQNLKNRFLDDQKNNEKLYQKMQAIVVEQKKPFKKELAGKKKNGEEYISEIYIFPILDKKGGIEFIVLIGKDITKAKEVDKTKTEFVSLASHQLRTPLSTVNWYTEMLLAEDAGKINEEQKKYLEEIYHGNQRMISLVNDLLNVSRIDLGTFVIKPEPVDFLEIAESVLGELLPQIKNKKIKIEKKYSQNLPKINVDKKFARIIFQNLLSNAVKYTPKSGKVILEIKKQKTDAFIKVADTGIGIPKEQQPKIFERLFRADNAKEQLTEGTGLGLYIVKLAVEKFGGKIWFESIEDKGTTFSATIPLRGIKATLIKKCKK